MNAKANRYDPSRSDLTGRLVRLAHPAGVGEVNARYVIVEDNGDRVLAKLVDDNGGWWHLPFAPVELLALQDVVEVTR